MTRPTVILGAAKNPLFPVTLGEAKNPRFMRPLSLASALFLAACASTPEPAPAPAPAAAVTDGCPTTVANFLALPDSTPVTKVAEPIKMEPRPLRPPYPRNLFGRNGKASVEVTVFVDTLGKPDMSTFKVIESTHPWLAQNLKSSIAKWRFRPAEVNGCKVPRTYKFGATVAG